MNFQIFISANSCMWLNICAKAKYLFFHTKKRCGNMSQNKSCENRHNYCKLHRKFAQFSILHNRNHQIQNCEKMSPIVRQNRHFLKYRGHCYTNKCKLLLC